MHSSVLSWVQKCGVAATLAALWLAPSVASADAKPVTAAVEPGAEDVRAELLEMRKGAAARLDGALRTKFEAMSDEALMELVNTPEGTAHSDDERAIRVAVSKEVFERQLTYETGDVKIGSDLATLRLGEDFRYLDPAETEKLLVQGWGNPPGMETLGMIVPANVSPLDDTHGWAVVVSYSEEGYVEDDDAEDIDYDELLEEMKADTLEANAERVKEGYGALELVGWAAPPRYDAATHRLYWAKELKFGDAPDHTVNYAIRVLGRKGVLELNAVAGMSQLAAVQREMERVLPRAEFESGSRYADFNPDVDKVAAYGIGGLIAGKVLAKVGFFAVLLKLIIAGKKLLIVGVFAIGALIAKVLRGRRSE